MAAPLGIVRTPLVHSPAIRAECVHYTGLSRAPTPETYEPETQVLITLGGAFVYHVGRSRQLVDANRVAFVQAGQRIRAPHNGLRDVYVVDPKAVRM